MPGRASHAHESGAATADPLVEPKGQKVGFLREFLRSPGSIGAVAPSGRQLCRKMVASVDMTKVKVAVEYGPGTGPCTDEIVPALAPGARFLAVEVNPRLARVLQQRHRGVKVHVRSAAEMSEICVEEGLPAEGAVDVIFSCLPWASFPQSLQNDIMAATMKVLRPGGVMVAFGYHVGLLTPAGRRFKKMLQRTFSKVERSGPVLKNLPTAFVYKCTK